METRDSEDMEKPQKKSWEIDEPARVKPELLTEEEMTPSADQIQNKEARYRTQIQRNSVFNRAVKHRSKSKSRTPEPNARHLSGQYQGQLPQRFLHIKLESSGPKGPN